MSRQTGVPSSGPVQPKTDDFSHDLDRNRTRRIGLRQRRARNRSSPEMVTLAGMAAQHRFYLAQALGGSELSMEHGDQMRFGAKPARIIAAMLRRKAVMDPPRDIFQEFVKHESLMRHGLLPFRIQMPRKQLETSRINAVRPFKHKLCRTAVGLTRPSSLEIQKDAICYPGWPPRRAATTIRRFRIISTRSNR